MNPLVLSHIYECSIAPKVHILLPRPWDFPICSSLKITPLVKISYKTQEYYNRQNLSTLTTTLFKFVGGVYQAETGLCFVLNYEFVSIQKNYCKTSRKEEVLQLSYPLRNFPLLLRDER